MQYKRFGEFNPHEWEMLALTSLQALQANNNMKNFYREERQADLLTPSTDDEHTIYLHAQLHPSKQC